MTNIVYKFNHFLYFCFHIVFPWQSLIVNWQVSPDSKSKVFNYTNKPESPDGLDYVRSSWDTRYCLPFSTEADDRIEQTHFYLNIFIK